MSTLSPADQIMIAVAHVHQAHGGDPPARAVAAAVLAAAADQVVPDQGDVWTRDLRGDAWIRWEERKLIRSDYLAIAAELGERP